MQVAPPSHDNAPFHHLWEWSEHRASTPKRVEDGGDANFQLPIGLHVSVALGSSVSLGEGALPGWPQLRCEGKISNTR